MNIYNYLKKDHKKVSQLFKHIIASSTAKERKKLFLELQKELELHADPEHETFYKALKESEEGEEQAEHGDKEHSEIKKSLKKLSQIPANETAKWFVQLGELKRIVEHHVEEEENEMFPEAKKTISEEEAEELALRMKELKEKMLESKSFKKKFSSDST